MVTYKRPKFAKVGKVGHANAGKHKAVDLLDDRAKLSALSAHRKGSAAPAKLRTQTGKGLRTEFGLPTIRKGSTR